MEVNEKKSLSSYRLPALRRRYFDLPAFLAQASLQYFDFASNVVYFFLQTGHFLSNKPTSRYLIHALEWAKNFSPRRGRCQRFSYQT